jgi:hypothetical protein
MNYMTSVPALTVGREQTCKQCGTLYHAIRSTSVYCSTACRNQAFRGVVPSNPDADDILLKRLTAMGYVGKIGPVNSRDPRSEVYGLTVPRSYALAELNARYNRPTGLSPKQASMTLAEALAAKPEKHFPDMTDTDFLSALRRLDIYGFDEQPKRGRR